MDHDFWLERWQQGRTAFHEGKTNALLSAVFPRLSLNAGDRVFVPLCGKAEDLDWLVAQGCRVVGAELSQMAVEAAFERMGLAPDIDPLGELTRYRAGAVEIFVGDVFRLTAEALGAVDAVYDRAALVALPEAMRRDYARHLIATTAAARQLLIAFEYDQTRMDGPPFSVPETEIRALYAETYALERAVDVDIGGPLAERAGSVRETAWLLKAD